MSPRKNLQSNTEKAKGNEPTGPSVSRSSPRVTGAPKVTVGLASDLMASESIAIPGNSLSGSRGGLEVPKPLGSIRALTEDERLCKIREILTYQVDLEILHKWRELRVIEEELQRGRQLRVLLEKLIFNEYMYGLYNDSAEYSSVPTISSRDGTPGFASGDIFLQNGSNGELAPFARRSARSVVSYAPTSRSSHNQSEKTQSEPQPQYEVRSDGAFVKMRCPKCGAEKFRSMLGFLNHCRIHCRLVFSSQDERLQKCGVLIDPSEVPLDYFNKHPTQIKQEMDLALIRADVTGPINDTQRKPMIKVNDSKQRPSTAEAFLLSNNCYDSSEKRPHGSMFPVNGEFDLNGSAEFDSQYAGTGVNNAFNATVSLDSAKRMQNMCSRFIIKKQIIIGNAAKSLLNKAVVNKGNDSGNGSQVLDEDENSIPVEEGKVPTHKWRLFIKNTRTAVDHNDDLRTFVRCVRFLLHPSYKPNEVVDVMQAPFEISRLCWGEFPIRIQIHFWDPRNKPIEIVHMLKVLTATTGKYIVTAEQVHDLELDRRTDFHISEKLSTSCIPLTAPQSSSTSVTDDDLLTMAVQDFPLFGHKGKRAANSRYRAAPSQEDFLRLDYNAQMALEIQRAAALTKYLMSSFPTFSKTTEDVIAWCREKRYTPAAVVTLVSEYERAEMSAKRLLYCRFCGIVHLPQDRFDILQKNCSLRPRKIHVTSRSAASDLIAKYRLLPENCEQVKRLKQEYMNSTSSIPLQEEPLKEPTSDVTDDEHLSFWVQHLLTQLHGAYGSRFEDVNLHMVSLFRVFARKFLEASVAEIPESKERSAERPSLLTPLHIYNAVNNNRLYDFLTNAYMVGGGLTSGNSTPGPSKKASPLKTDPLAVVNDVVVGGAEGDAKPQSGAAPG